MAPSKAFAASNSKFVKESATPNTKQKSVRSRNNDVGKQTVDHNPNKNSQWLNEKQLKTTQKLHTESVTSKMATGRTANAN